MICTIYNGERSAMLHFDISILVQIPKLSLIEVIRHLVRILRMIPIVTWIHCMMYIRSCSINMSF